MVAPLNGLPSGGQTSSGPAGRGKRRMVTSISGSSSGTPSRDFPCRRSSVMAGIVATPGLPPGSFPEWPAGRAIRGAGCQECGQDRVRAPGVACRLRHEQFAQEEAVPWQFENPRLAVVVEAAEPQARPLQRLAVGGIETEGAVEPLDGRGGVVEATVPGSIRTG